ncbi:hypothetical protein ACROYT_G042285 [Oculina patagonica]
MKVICRNNAFTLLCARRNLLKPSVVLSKRWESNTREAGSNKDHRATRSTSASGSPSRSKFNLVGPRDYKSNIRKIVYAKSKDETNTEKYFREQQQELNTWHQDFWERQNEKFSKSKKAFLQLRPRNLENDTNKELADDLSKFYKNFLDGHYKVHSQYLRAWYRRNFHLLWTGLQASTSRFLSKIIPKRSR